MFDLTAYLDRIAIPRPAAPTGLTLSELHRAHVAVIPFENIDVRLGRRIALDLDSLERKLVHARRGGYCFERNTLFATALRALGFEVATLEARVRPLADERHPYQAVWSSDGQWIVARTTTNAGEDVGARDILAYRPGLDSEAMPLVSTESAEYAPALSPDGRWRAYTSSIEGGRQEVYVSPFPDTGSSRTRVSTDGGSRPRWAHSGRELFFRDPDGGFVAAAVQADPEFRVVQRETLFTLGLDFVSSATSDFYDVGLDDQRFLVGRLAIQEPLVKRAPAVAVSHAHLLR